MRDIVPRVVSRNGFQLIDCPACVRQAAARDHWNKSAACSEQRGQKERNRIAHTSRRMLVQYWTIQRLLAPIQHLT